MKVPFLDLRSVNLRQKKLLNEAFESFLDSGYYILGNNLSKFESEFAHFSGSKYCLGVGNGLDALVLSLRALNIGPGDEVIVPSNTYIATWLAVSQVGADVIPVEPRIGTYNLNPELIQDKITERTRAIIPVHLYGQVAEMDAICSLAAKSGVFVIEDNAQAQGATHLGKRTGSWGNVNATSFYPGKNLGCLGDGGAITTDDEQIKEKILMLRNYGSKIKYYNEIKGYNSRLDEIQAAFLSVKLSVLDMDNAERRNLALYYNRNLKNIGDLVLPELLCDSVFHIYVIRTKRRNELQEYLSSRGIGSLIHYPVPPHLQKAYSELNYKKGSFPVAEEIAETCLSLPLFPGMTAEQIEYVVDNISKFYSE